MELRKDPITRSWVITGDDVPALPQEQECPYCPDAPRAPQVISTMPGVDGGAWSARAVVHPAPLYHVEGDPQRKGNGLYDKMRSVGAHEVLLENRLHDRQLWNASDAEVEQVLLLAGQRILDLKQDRRLKYVTVFKDYGEFAGQDIAHPSFQLMGTMFVPRRVLYELRAAREYYQQKERCVFCDILAQEERQVVRMVERRGDYLALCPYAARVPYETWLLSRTHDAAFERQVNSRNAGLEDLSALLRHTLKRILSVSHSFHLVLHTSPNSLYRSEVLGYWKTIDDDYHWHIEILPIVASKIKSYTVKESYFTPITPETAAARLREASPE
jgi:UDPglucose--hexose-1-phosphate uridylyltransferase